MIEWLITDNNFIFASLAFSLIIVTIAIACFLARDESSGYVATFSFSDWALVSLLDIIISLVLTFFFVSFFSYTIVLKPNLSSEWKTIYDSTADHSNAIEIAKSLSDGQKASETSSDSIASNLSESETSEDQNVKINISYGLYSAEAGNEIGEKFADVFSNLSDSKPIALSLRASKSDYEKSKNFVLFKESLISNGDIVKSSKIVKVEIKNSEYLETEFFGFKGTNQYAIHNEVRITLDSDTSVQKEVNEIFE